MRRALKPETIRTLVKGLSGIKDGGVATGNEPAI
jgi:hypothetical protein